MSSFPLYDTLYYTVELNPAKDEPIDKNKLIKNISSMDTDGHNKIYALIRYYSINNHPQDIEIIPFSGHFVNDDILFDLDKFPLLLQHILLEFTKLHSKHMKYSQKFEKIRKKSSDNK